jgi:hypothetical protein
MEVSCDYVDEHSGSIAFWTFLEREIKRQLLKSDSLPQFFESV